LILLKNRSTNGERGTDTGLKHIGSLRLHLGGMLASNRQEKPAGSIENGP
jgi:hypothetical protein